MEPDAQEIELLRQHSEHKYLKVHDSFFNLNNLNNSMLDLSDKLAQSISRSEFENKALRMTRFSRAGLIYLYLVIQIEESRRRQDLEPNTPIIPIVFSNWKDEWKR